MISVEQLLDILEFMSKDYLLEANTLGNFRVMDKNKNFIGYIDFKEKKFYLINQKENGK